MTGRVVVGLENVYSPTGLENVYSPTGLENGFAASPEQSYDKAEARFGPAIKMLFRVKACPNLSHKLCES